MNFNFYNYHDDCDLLLGRYEKKPLPYTKEVIHIHILTKKTLIKCKRLITRPAA